MGSIADLPKSSICSTFIINKPSSTINILENVAHRTIIEYIVSCINITSDVVKYRTHLTFNYIRCEKLQIPKTDVHETPVSLILPLAVG